MSVILQPTFILLLFVLIRSGDIAIGAIAARNAWRAVTYGLLALIALLGIFVLFGAR
jgi:hypothetical protein